MGKVWTILKKVGSKLKGGTVAAVKYGAKRAPLLSALLTGAALAFPAAGPVLGFLSALLAGNAQPGQVVADPALAGEFAKLLAGAPLLWGSLYKYALLALKTWRAIKPLLTPESDAPANPGK
jgi:hypothetical protein